MYALRRRIIGRKGQVSCLRVAEVVSAALHSTSYPIPVVSSFCKFLHRSLGDSDQNFSDTPLYGPRKGFLPVALPTCGR